MPPGRGTVSVGHRRSLLLHDTSIILHCQESRFSQTSYLTISGMCAHPVVQARFYGGLQCSLYYRTVRSLMRARANVTRFSIRSTAMRTLSISTRSNRRSFSWYAFYFLMRAHVTKRALLFRDRRMRLVQMRVCVHFIYSRF